MFEDFAEMHFGAHGHPQCLIKAKIISLPVLQKFVLFASAALRPKNSPPDCFCRRCAKGRLQLSG